MSTHLGTSSGNLRADTPSTMRATSSHTCADSCSVTSASGQVHDRTPNGDRLHRQRAMPTPTSDVSVDGTTPPVALACCCSWAVTMLDIVTMLATAASSSMTAPAGAEITCDATSSASLHTGTQCHQPKSVCMHTTEYIRDSSGVKLVRNRGQLRVER